MFQNRDELRDNISELDKHFSRFGLTMHLGSMFFPASLKQAKSLSTLPEDITLPNGKRIHFTSKFKYLGSIITPLLNEDIEIEARIKKAKSMMGLSKHFFDNKDVDRRLKYQVYTSGPVNALLWGCETIMERSDGSYILSGSESRKNA